MKTSFWHIYADFKLAHIVLMWKTLPIKPNKEDFIKLLKRPGNNTASLTTEILT